MRKADAFLLSVTALTFVGLAAVVNAKPAPSAKPTGDAALIHSAMSAAPASVAKDATVVVAGKDGMRTLKKGSNGFTCMPDTPETPGPDPMCLDANAMAWGEAYFGHKPPPEGKVGLIYMLAGGTDASNTDPYAKGPTATNNWIKTGPHVMVVGAPSLLASYPKNPKPDTSSPYVMWAGTPYEHLMIPVR
jgi:hypothetical protein